MFDYCLCYMNAGLLKYSSIYSDCMVLFPIIQCYDEAKLLMQNYLNLQKNGHRSYANFDQKEFNLTMEGRSKLQFEVSDTVDVIIQPLLG